MAITTASRIAGPFAGNGATTVFPFTFRMYSTTDLFVLVADHLGNLSILLLGTDYTAVLNSNQDTSPGGSVTLTAALATGSVMTVTSDVAALQGVVLTNLGGFFPTVLNDVFDRLTILIQQLQLEVSQCIRLSVTDDLATAQLPPAAARANQLLYFGADGAVSLLSTAGGLIANFAGNLTGTQDGTNQIFTFTNHGVPIGKAPLDALVWNNVPLILNLGYSLGPAPGQVTFTAPPDPADNLYAKGTFSA